MGAVPSIRGTLRLAALASIVAGALVVLALVSASLAASQGLAVRSAYLLVGSLGLVLPLLAILYALTRRRIAVIVLAFSVGLCVNVVFLAHAVPANAAASNSSTLYVTPYFTFGCGGPADGPQTNSDTGPGSFAGGAGNEYDFCSDTFAPPQSLGAGTTTASVTFSNSSVTKDCLLYGELYWWHTSSNTAESLGASANQTIPHSTNTATTFTWSWTTSGTTGGFASGDRLWFRVQFQFGSANCNNTTLWTTTLAQPSLVTVATIVPEPAAGLLLLAPALPVAMRWWWRRHESTSLWDVVTG